MSSELDPEILALTRCFEALRDLDHSTRWRIIKWLRERFETESIDRVTHTPEKPT